MIVVKLHGILGKSFTREGIEVHTESVGDVIEYLLGRFGNKFRNIIENGNWHLIKGKKTSNRVSKNDTFISEEELLLPVDSNELHIFPAVQGAGGKGIGQIILGVVLIVVAVVLTIFFPPAGAAVAGTISGVAYSATAASIALAGVMSIAGGVMAMMTKTPTMGSYEGAASADARPSFLFNGVVNNTEQGVPVPLVLGRHLTGSTVIYAGMDTVQL